MAILTIPDEQRELRNATDIAAHLSQMGITYEQWEPTAPLGPNATQADILAAYAPYIEALKARGGYITADVIDITPQTPNLEAMLAKFRDEHWHDEDEVRFILSGRGVFHIHPAEGAVVAVTVEAGDLLLVPTGTYHWFDLCEDRQIRAIRLFQDPAGWTPLYTQSGLEQQYKSAPTAMPSPMPVG
jgi:1,2-dihydroxy-3-keto-5-methylthiopentene dioxygenase